MNFATNFEEKIFPGLKLSVFSLGKLLGGFWIHNYLRHCALITIAYSLTLKALDVKLYTYLS